MKKVKKRLLIALLPALSIFVALLLYTAWRTGDWRLHRHVITFGDNASIRSGLWDAQHADEEANRQREESAKQLERIRAMNKE